MQGLLLTFTWIAHAFAEPLARVETNADCPTVAALTTALAGRRLPDAARAYGLALRKLPDGADLTLSDGAGSPVLERRLTSPDCTALADAAALITEAYFVELAAHSASGASAPASPSSSAAAPSPVPPPTSPPAIATATPSPSPSPSPTPTPSSASHSAPITFPRLTAAIGGGADVYLEKGAVAANAQLGVGLWPTDRLELEAHGVLATQTTLDSPPNEVLRLERRAALRALPWFGATPLIAPWAGVGAALTRLEALDLSSAPERSVWSPILEGGVATIVPVTRQIALGAELGCHVLLTRETYVIAPEGEVGTGPRFGCSLIASASWSNEPLVGRAASAQAASTR
jgi:hypothetical protein